MLQAVSPVVDCQRVVFVGGLPATGKTYFSRWLSREHDFTHFELEEKPVRDALGLGQAWRALRDHRDASLLIAAIRRRRCPVVVDWGFHPRWLDAVQQLGAAAAELWWFDGDRQAAREAFCARATIPADCFDRQIVRIERCWPEIVATFGDGRLDVLRARGERMSPASIWAKMNQDAGTSWSPRAAARQRPYLPKSTSG